MGGARYLITRDSQIRDSPDAARNACVPTGSTRSSKP